MTRMPRVQQMAKEISTRSQPQSQPGRGRGHGGGIQADILTSGKARRRPCSSTSPASLRASRRWRRHDEAHRAQHDHPGPKKGNLSTAADNQPAVDIHVLQGEREFAGDNRTSRTLPAHGIPPAPRACPRSRSAFRHRPRKRHPHVRRQGLGHEEGTVH